MSVPKVAYLEPERQEASASLPVDDEINYKLVRPNFYIYFESF